MVSLAEKVPVDQITARGRQAEPGRVLLTLVLGVFFAFGWTAGRAWLMAADCWTSVRIGWLRGKGLGPEEITRRMAPPAPAPAA